MRRVGRRATVWGRGDSSSHVTEAGTARTGVACGSMSIIDGFLADVAEAVARETRRSPGVRPSHLARIDAIAQFLV